MSTQKNHGPTKYANSNLNSVFAKSSTSSSAASGGPVVNKFNGMLVLSKQRSRTSSTVAGPKLAVPKPVNLPSMRKEHAGNDPTTVLVPTGGTGAGWNKPEEPVVQPADSARGPGPSSGGSWAANRTQSPAWAPTPSEAAKASQGQGVGRSGPGPDRHLNPEEYPSLGATARAQSQPLPRRSVFADQGNQDHLWTDDERNVPSAAPYRQSPGDWSRDVDDDRFVPRAPWDRDGPGSFYPNSRSFSTSELADDYVPRRFEFDPPPPPPARRPGSQPSARDGRGYGPGFEFYHDDTSLFPPPPPPPGRPHDAAASDKSEEEDLEREAFYETLDKVAAELEKRKEEAQKEKEKEREAHITPEPAQAAKAEPEAVEEPIAAALPFSPPPPPPPPPPPREVVEVEKDQEKEGSITDGSKSDLGSDSAARNKLVIQPRKSQREIEYEEEERRRKAAAAEKLRQLEERMERQRREKEEAEQKARAEEEAAKKAAAAALQPPAPALVQVAPAGVVAVPEPSGLSTPNDEEGETWEEKGFKVEEDRALVVEEEEEDAEPPKPAEPAPVPTAQGAASPVPGNAWQRGPPIQPSIAAEADMAARFGSFDDDLLEDISKAAKQQVAAVVPAPRAATGKVHPGAAAPAPDSHLPAGRAGQVSWRAQPKAGEEAAEPEAGPGFERSSRRTRGGRGSRGGRTPDSDTPRSGRSSAPGSEAAEPRAGRGKTPRNERGSERQQHGSERGPRGAKDDAAVATEQAGKGTAEAADTAPVLAGPVAAAAAEVPRRPDTAHSEQSSTDSMDARGKRNANGRMIKDALVPAPSSTNISKAPGAGRAKGERAPGARGGVQPATSGADSAAAAQAAAAVAAAVAGVTASAPSSSNTTAVSQASQLAPGATPAATSLLAPTLLSPRAPAPLPAGPSSQLHVRTLDSRGTNPTVDVKVPAPIGPSAQPSPQPIARSPVNPIGNHASPLWGPNIVKDIANMSLGPPLSGSDPLLLGTGLPAAGKPVLAGPPGLSNAFDRQIGPRQGVPGKDLGATPESLAGDVLGNGMPKFPDSIMDVMQPPQKVPPRTGPTHATHAKPGMGKPAAEAAGLPGPHWQPAFVSPQPSPSGPPLPFPPPAGAGSNMVRPLGPTPFPFHPPADTSSAAGSAAPGAGALNLWGPAPPLSFGQHPAGPMHHNPAQPAPSGIGATGLESFYNHPTIFPNASLPMHPPAAPPSPTPHHANPPLMSPGMLASLQQYGQHFPNLYGPPHTHFGNMTTTFGQFPNQPAFIPTGKQPDWSTPNPIGISPNPVLNPGLVRPPGIDSMLPAAYPNPLSGSGNQAGSMGADATPHFGTALNPSLGAAQQPPGLPSAVPGLGGVPSSSAGGFPNIMGPGAKPGPGGGANPLNMKLGQGAVGSNLMMSPQRGGASQVHKQQHEAGPVPGKGGVPQLPDDVFPGMEPSNTMSVREAARPMPVHSGSNGPVDRDMREREHRDKERERDSRDSNPGSKQSTPPGLAPPQASQQLAHSSHHQHHHHGGSGSGDRQGNGPHEPHGRGMMGGHSGSHALPPGPAKHGGRGGRGASSNSAGAGGGGRGEHGGRGGGRGGGRMAGSSPMRSSDSGGNASASAAAGSNSGSRSRGGSGSARGGGGPAAAGPSQDKPQASAHAQNAVAAAAAAAATAALSATNAGAKDTSGPPGVAGPAGNASSAAAPPSARNAGDSGGRSRGGGGGGRNGGGFRSGGANSRGGRAPAGGPKTMYVPKGTIPANATPVKTEVA